MGRGKKTQELEAALCQGTGGKNPTTDAPQRATTASNSGCTWALPSAPCRLFLSAIFLCGYIKLEETHTPPYLGEPQALIRLTETIFQTHRPTWDDIIQLLASLFSTEERHRILTEARKWLRKMAPEGTANSQQWAELATPDERPN